MWRWVVVLLALCVAQFGNAEPYLNTGEFDAGEMMVTDSMSKFYF